MIMKPNLENIIDLTSDNEDELRCAESLIRSTTGISHSNLQPAQLYLVDHVAIPSPSKRKSELPHLEGNKLATTDNLLNSRWDGFDKPRQRNPSAFRTPSPLSGGQMEPNGNKGIAEPHSSNYKKKRLRERSISVCGKRMRYGSLISIDRDANLKINERLDEDGQYDVYRGSPAPIAREATTEELNHSVIILEHEEELEDFMEISSENWHKIAKERSSMNPGYLLIDLDDQEEELFEEVEMMAPRETTSPGRSGTVLVSRNLPITPPWVTQQSVQTESNLFQVGDIVELKSLEFFRIMIIMKNLETDNFRLRGYSLERTRELNGMLPKKINELYLNVEVELDDPRDPTVQAMIEVDLGQILAVRETVMTNQVFPSFTYRNAGGFHDEMDALRNAPCAVRWKYSCKYLTARDRWHNRWYERSIEHLKANDLSADDSQSTIVSDSRVRLRYRGNTVLGGEFLSYGMSDDAKPFTTIKSHRRSNSPGTVIIDGDDSEVDLVRRSVSVIDLSHKDQKLHSAINEGGNFDKELKQIHVLPVHNNIDLSNSGVGSPPSEGFITLPRTEVFGSASHKITRRLPGQKYTYGDCFCGAGGASRGAVMAGLKVIWGFDKDIHACNSWQLNFPDATLYHEWADELIQRGMKNPSCLRSDILHLSPPCQYFSPAHTLVGKDDEMNMASLFACGMLLDVAKPRIATLEQTFGIVLLSRFQIYFNALIQMFTDRGFSIRWKICHLQDWGLPQRRQRLIIIASCPGEMLPEFPPFTHADPRKASSDLPPWVSVNSIIRNIPRGAPDHDIDLVEAKPLNCRPWSGESIAPRCITTHGGHNYHPNGKRGFTLREFASLQGFPMNHRFTQVNVKKQIGNAVPPCIAKVLFSWIRKALEKADGILPEGEQAEIWQAGNFQSDAIVLD